MKNISFKKMLELSKRKISTQLLVKVTVQLKRIAPPHAYIGDPPGVLASPQI